MANGEAAARLHVSVGADISRAERDVTKWIKQLETAAAASRRHVATLDQASPAHARAGLAAAQDARQHEQLINAQVRAARASGNFTGALALLERELQTVSQGTSRHFNLLAQHAQVTRQSEVATQRAARATQSHGSVFATASAGVLQMASALGIANTAIGAFSAVMGKVKEGFNLVAALDQNRRSLGILLGDMERGNETFARAIAWGQKFGFTQREIGESVSSAARIMRKSGADIETVLSVLTRLQALSPEQGIFGATIALNEIAAGDTMSLVRRFEVPRQAAKAMVEEIKAGKDPVMVLDAALNQMGATSELLSARMQGAAGAQHQAQIASENLALALGKIAQSHGAIAVLEGVAAAANKVADFLDFGFNENQIAFIETAAQGYDAYAAAVNRANQQQGALEASIVALTPAQFEAANAMIAQGVAAADAFAAMERLTFIAGELTPTYLNMIGVHGEAQAAILAYADAALVLAATSPQVASGIQALIDGLMNGTVSSDEFTAAIASMTAAQHAAAPATAATTKATQDQAAAIANATEQAVLDEIASQALATAKQTLTDKALAAATAFVTLGDGSDDARQRFAALFGVSVELVAGLEGVARQAQLTNEALAGMLSMEERADVARNAALERATAELPARNAAATKAATDALWDQQFALADTAGKIALLTEKQKQYVAGTEQWIRLQTQIKQLQASGGAGGGGTSLENARTRAETAGLTPQQELSYWQNRIKSLKAGSEAYFEAQARIKDLQARVSADASRDTAAAAGKAAQEAERLDRAKLASMTDPQRLAELQRRLPGLTGADRQEALSEIATLQERIAKSAEQTANARQKDADALRDAQRALMSDEQRLADLRKELSAGGMPEVERLRLVKEIRDLEGSIARARQQAAATGAREAEQAANERTRAAKEAAREARALREAQRDLMGNEELLADLRRELAGGNLPEAERLRLLDRIRDVEKDITSEREKQTEAAIDAQLAILDDRKRRLDEVQEAALASRVLRHSDVAEMREAAAIVQARIPLEQAKRQHEIAELIRASGGTAASAAAAVPVSSVRPIGPMTPLISPMHMPSAMVAGATDATPLISAFIHAVEDMDWDLVISGDRMVEPVVARLRQGRTQARSAG